MTNVFDFQDFMSARLADESNPRLRALAQAVLDLHQPVLVTWHPRWFCSCCEGDDEPQHHMGMSSLTMHEDGTTDSWSSDGPLMKAGADWPCATALAVAAVYSDHTDFGHWISGIRQLPSPGKAYVLQGGPLSDGRGRIRPSQPAYLDDPAWGPNDSVITMLMHEPENMDGKPVVAVQDAGGAYIYRAATDTIEWEQRQPDPQRAISKIRYGALS